MAAESMGFCYLSFLLLDTPYLEDIVLTPIRKGKSAHASAVQPLTKPGCPPMHSTQKALIPVIGFLIRALYSRIILSPAITP